MKATFAWMFCLVLIARGAAQIYQPGAAFHPGARAQAIRGETVANGFYSREAVAETAAKFRDPQSHPIDWKELLRILIHSRDNLRTYVDGDERNNYGDRYVCANYAVDLFKSMQQQGFKAWIVGIDYEQPPSHAIVAVETSDNGTIFVDFTAGRGPSKRLVRCEEGKPLVSIDLEELDDDFSNSRKTWDDFEHLGDRIVSAREKIAASDVADENKHAAFAIVEQYVARYQKYRPNVGRKIVKLYFW